MNVRNVVEQVYYLKKFKMEVTLKKTKITSSILKQTVRSTVDDLTVGEIIGWCLYSGLKFMICFRKDTNSLSKYPIFKEITFIPQHKDNGENRNYLVKVHLGGMYAPHTYTCSDYDEVNNVINILNNAKNMAELKGQFYI